MRPLARVLTALLLALASTVGSLALPTTPPAAAAEAVVNGVRLNSYESRLLALINQSREAHGLGKLAVSAGTTDVARRWSWRLAAAQGLSHNPNLVSDISGAGSSAWMEIAENVGMAPSDDPGMLFTAYMNSPPHRANILDPGARYIGVGVVERADVAWNTLDFVDAYSTGYGRTRVPADGITRDAVTLTSTTDVAGMENRDQRVGTAGHGSMRSTLAHFTGPSSSDDAAYADVRRVSSRHGYADLLLRDALDLSRMSRISVRLSATSPTGRAVRVHIRLATPWVSAVSVGAPLVRAGAGWYTFTLPSSARRFRSTVDLSLLARDVSAVGGRARVRVYDVRALA